MKKIQDKTRRQLIDWEKNLHSTHKIKVCYQGY